VADAKFYLQLFSKPELRRPGMGESLLPAGKPLAALAFLVVEERPVAREELADLLWPHADRTRGKASVRQALWNLRRVLGPSAFTSEDPVSLAPGVVEADLVRFRAFLETSDLKKAREIWKGALLNGLEFPGAREWLHWIDDLRSLEERRFGASLASLAEVARGAGDHRSAREWLETAVEVQPYSAPLHIALIETLLESHAFQVADEALSAARGVLDDPENLELLGDLEDRLSVLRIHGGAEAEPQSLQTEFVGRTAEFSGLAAKWRRAKGGRPELALIVGEPGIGKTRLAEELAHLVVSEGGTRISVKAVEVERGLRWGTASELVRALHSLPGAAGISNRSASVLARLVPSLGGLAELTSSRGGAVESVAVTDALLDLVNAVAEEGPVLLHVDDLQWVDKESRATLSHMARNLGNEALLLVITCRTGERDPEVKKAVESLQRMEGSDILPLAPLGSLEVSELLALLLEEVEPEELDTLGVRIHAITQGNPLFIVEILKLFHGQGLLRPMGRRKWAIARSCLDGQLPVPETVESAIEGRLADLGEHAQHIAGHLAWQARPMAAEELRRQTRMDPFEVSEGIRELLDKDLIRRNSQEQVQFVHDSVTEVARKHLRVPSGTRKTSGASAPLLRRMGWTAAVLVILASAIGAMGVLTGLGPLGFLERGGDGAAPPSYPYGSGRILVQTTGDAFWLRPPSSEDGEWGITSAELPYSHSRLFGPFPVEEDSVLWFVNHADSPDDPPYAGIPQHDGTVRPIWKIPGDVGFKDLSPDGETALVVQENLETATYDRDLLAIALESGQARILYRAPELITDGLWSPDGLTIALVERGIQDSIRLMNPRGEHLASFGFDTIEDFGGISWCPDSRRLIFSTYLQGRQAFGSLEVSTGNHQLLGTTLGGRSVPLCLGTGRHVVVRGLLNDEFHLVLLDLESGAAVPLFSAQEGFRITRYRWVPDSPEAVFRSLAIHPSHPEVRWGSRTSLSATGLYSDGTIRPVEVTWEALDPNRASVDSVGVVTGNQAGTAKVVAQFTTWIADTVEVRVLQWERPDVVLRSNFQAEDLAEWEQFSSPPARSVEVEGEMVLSLEGDGRYHDVLVSKETFSLDEGARMEVEFRLDLTRTDRQKIVFCIEPARADEAPLEVSFPGWESDSAFCLRYPAEELVKFDPSEAVASYDRLGLRESFRLPEGTDSSEWTQFALEIQPDGSVAISVNQSLVETVSSRVIIEPGSQWRIQLGGASVDTHLYVRGVTVYSGSGDG